MMPTNDAKAMMASSVSDSVKQYKRKPRIVEAQQWLGGYDFFVKLIRLQHNHALANIFSAKKTCPKCNQLIAGHFALTCETDLVCHRDFVVRDQAGQLQVWDEITFFFDFELHSVIDIDQGGWDNSTPQEPN